VKIQQKEILFAGIGGVAAVAAVSAMPLLVAAPKLLFGRSLSAISPSLFPYLTLALIALLSASIVLLSWLNARKTTTHTTDDPVSIQDADSGLTKTIVFFALLAGYGLLLKPAGFLISSFLVISATSFMLGNRNWIQIFLLALLAPVFLYLIATRAMLVSLPELNPIELWYAKVIELAFTWFRQ